MHKISSLLSSAALVFFMGAAPIPVTAQSNAPNPAVERGRSAYGANCGFCHGSQATGTEQAPSLVRSPIVRNDVNGNALMPLIKAGRPTLGMPSFASLPSSQIFDIVAFLHARAAQARGHRVDETSLLVGNAKEGEGYFTGTGGCSGCHSTTGNLAHIGSKYSPLSLTMAFLTPVPKPLQVKVTLPSRETASGTVEYMDEFTVSLTDASGEHRTWSRDLLESVKVIDPLAVHQEMLAKYTDTDIHNLLAYLVTLK